MRRWLGWGALSIAGLLLASMAAFGAGNFPLSGTWTRHSLLYVKGRAMSDLGAATDGQLPIGDTGGPPVLATITSPNITVTNGAGSIAFSVAKLTAGTGTGLTVNQVGLVGTTVYKVSLAKEAFAAASVSNDITIATLPAGTIVHSVVARVGTQFACSATCTSSSLSATLGVTAGGTEFLASFDLDAAAATFGDADGELGSALTIAGQFNSGYVSILTGTTTVVLRGTSGTGNWGTAGVTHLAAGALTIYIVATVLPV